MNSINPNIQIKPIRANIEITNLCNLRCTHCYFYSNYDYNIKHRGLSLTELKKLIKKLKNEGIFELSIGGGEPFCYPKIKEILLLATQKMFTVVSTNGLLLNEKTINFLKKLPNFCLQISLDGQEKIHKKIRNIDSYHFKLLIKIIKTCVINKVDLKIGFMLCRLNVRDVEYICKFCLKEHIKKLAILTYIGENEKLQLSKYNFYKVAKILKKYINKLKINIRDPFLHFLVFGEKGCCEAGKLTFNIDYQGNVSPCCYIDNSNIGNIFDLKIKNIPSICEKKIRKIKNRNFCIAQKYL